MNQCERDEGMSRKRSSFQERDFRRLKEISKKCFRKLLLSAANPCRMRNVTAPKVMAYAITRVVPRECSLVPRLNGDEIFY